MWYVYTLVTTKKNQNTGVNITRPSELKQQSSTNLIGGCIPRDYKVDTTFNVDSIPLIVLGKTALATIF